MDCLVTKLKGLVNDDNLLKLGDLRASMSSNVRVVLQWNATKNATVRIIGNSYFSDSTYTNNDGKSKNVSGTNIQTYVKFSGDSDIIVPDKYDLADINLSGVNVDIVDISYIRALASLMCKLFGDLEKMNDFICKSYISSITSFSSPELYGNLGGIDFSDYTKLVTFNITGSKIEGSIEGLSKGLSLQYVDLGSNPNVTGDISALNALSNLRTLSVRNTKAYGDIGKLPDSLYKFDANGTFTFKTNRLSSAYCIALPVQVNLGSDLDAFLINNAQCTFYSTSDQYAKIINATGTRTSASDNAISTLQGKGFTVTVPVVTEAKSISLMSSDTDNYGIAYKDKELIVEPVDLSKMQIYPAKGVSVQMFDNLENAEKFIVSSGLVKSEIK